MSSLMNLSNELEKYPLPMGGESRSDVVEVIISLAYRGRKVVNGRVFVAVNGRGRSA